MRILVVDDDSRIRDVLRRQLSYEGYQVELAGDSREAFARVADNPPDLVVLDWMLPGMDGLEICRRLRQVDDMPIIMLTAKGTLDDKVDGLDSGADDYLVKPFEPEELLARVRALGRRTTPAAPPVLSAGDIELDSAKRTVTRGGELIDLTRKEFGVLETLLMAQGAVVSSEELLDRVWDENADPFTTTVRVTVMTLRKKLGEPGVIETVVGAGYRVPAAG
jgi:DNA-binding response OmpR family regulator